MNHEHSVTGIPIAGAHIWDTLLRLSHVGGITTNIVSLRKVYVGDREDGRHDNEREGSGEGSKQGNTDRVEQHGYLCGEKSASCEVL